MPTQHDDAWLVIRLVREGLQQLAADRLRSQADSYASLNPSLQRLSALSRSYDHACRRGFTGACRRLEPRIADQSRHLTQQLQQLLAGQSSPLIPFAQRLSRELPSTAFLLAELEQIEAEFGGWEVRDDQRSLFVTTDPIMLEGVPLGSFEIELCLDDLDRLHLEQPLKIHALDPNWASGADDVPHPHVRDERLCTGDATSILTQSLREGRLADYLMIVRQTLHTYNEDSPHVALVDWDGTPCHDCGCSMHADDRYYCDGCERDYCDECFGCCQCCSTALCYGCLSTCRFCDDATCESCLAMCSECEQSCCQGCIEEDLCPECYEQKELNHVEEESEPQEESRQQEVGQTVQTDPVQSRPGPSPAVTPDIPAITFAGSGVPSGPHGIALDGGLDRRVAHG